MREVQRGLEFYPDCLSHALFFEEGGIFCVLWNDVPEAVGLCPRLTWVLLYIS